MKPLSPRQDIGVPPGGRLPDQAWFHLAFWALRLPSAPLSDFWVPCFPAHPPAAAPPLAGHRLPLAQHRPGTGFLHIPSIPTLAPGLLGTFSLPDEVSLSLHLQENPQVVVPGGRRERVQDTKWSQRRWNTSVQQIITVCKTLLSMAVGDPVERADFGS